MQAVIMAAGQSTRTHPLTSTRPKPLVPIWDRPLLEHQLRQLDGLVDEVILVVGFLREQIEARFGDSYHGIRIRYALQERQRGTADALLAARPLLTSRTLVLNGDDFYHRDDLRELASRGRGILVSRAKDPQNRAVVELDGDVVTGIVEKPRDPPRDAWCSIGGYCVEKDDLRYLDDIALSPRGELELPDFILLLVQTKEVRAKTIDRFWLPITYSWDVLRAALFLWEEPERARELGLEGPVHLAGNVRVHETARLEGPTAIGSGSRIAALAVVERSILFDDVEIGEGAIVADSVLGQGVSVGASARIESLPGAELEIEVKGKKVVPEIDRLGAVVRDGASIAAGTVVRAGSLI
jgi:UDP-N-acetylglucosamine diphosphorylase / glucose-1-phosphate thymidylyltransferase / UDP-N-acetylgalactosamine diphosphorylase / glucosamine-1-phosphate N-acetyltransferase / galactosamine-1-phosphate N-acetyltransferase